MDQTILSPHWKTSEHQVIPYFFMFSAICYYSAASTADAAYIIGGYYTSEVVAEFKNNEWSRLKDLSKARYGHGSLSVGEQTIIIGGGTYPSAT